MEINTWILIIGGLAVMFFGYFFGLIEGRGQGYKKREGEEKTVEPPTQPREPAVRPAESPAVTANAAPMSPVLPGQPPLLSLREDGGRSVLELDGTVLDEGTLSIEQRRRLVEVVTRLRPWVESPVRAEAPAAPSAPAPIPAATRAAAVALPEEPAPTSMVGQISAILDEMIEGTTLAGRGIRLLEEPGGGVIVMVDGNRYGSIAEVTDPEIQAAIRAAIARWEKKYTPGL